MRVLLDTNILIHREANRIINYDIGQLFNWLNKLHYDKYIHPISLEEIERYKDKKTVEAFTVKLESYNLLKHPLPFSQDVENVSKKIDVNDNDKYDTALLNEVFEETIDILITEDKKIHTKAKLLNISDKVFRIQSFLEQVTSENPELVDYKVLSVKKSDFGELNHILREPFFDSFREDYQEFDKWFKRKSDNTCYVCYSEEELTAFLFVKVEEAGSENYSDINPAFKKKKRLKIGTLKVASNGYKIGERFLKIVFDNALQYKVEEIYVTVFNKRPEQEQLIEMLKGWGFIEHGNKTTPNGEEIVLTREFNKKNTNIKNPKKTFPFFSWDTRKYIVKIEHQYHTELFPDSINTREDKSKYIDNKPHRNRIGKVYISHNKDRHLKSGDILIMYRMGEERPKKYSSTVTSICIVEDVITNFKSFEDFYDVCKRRTLIMKDELEKDWWNRFPKYRPFVVKFLFAHSFPTPKPTLNDLNRIGVIPDIMNMPRGFIELNTEQFRNLANFAYKKKR